MIIAIMITLIMIIINIIIIWELSIKRRDYVYIYIYIYTHTYKTNKKPIKNKKRVFEKSKSCSKKMCLAPVRDFDCMSR